MSHDSTRSSRRRRDEGVRRHRHAPKSQGERLHPVIAVSAVPRRALAFGTVVRASVNFRESEGHKCRPVVVLDVSSTDVLCLICTTSEKRMAWREKYHEVIDLTTAGLTAASGIDLRPRRVERRDLIEVLGNLSEIDREALTSVAPIRGAA